MDRTIVFLRRESYGRFLYYPVCDKAHIFTDIAGTKTLDNRGITRIHNLGFAVQVTLPEQPTHAELF